ncbi:MULTISPECIES: alpha/beta hydrolase [Kitasatospora]|uniref:Alpha/beta hydrolase-fold protein n=1 Tax=Kitasatospora cystarginea TaxID=58350 RepID=A0ABP5QPZ3_9ACTN
MSSRPLAAPNPLDWPLTHGAVLFAVMTVGIAALLGLGVPGGRRWWRRRLPGAVVAAAVLTVLLQIAVDDWWQPFPEELPIQVTAWIGVGLLALALAVARLLPPGPGRRRGRFGVVLAAVLVLLMSSDQVNGFFEQYPSGRVLLDSWFGRAHPLTVASSSDTVAAPSGRALAEVWRRPEGLPAKGTVSSAPVPGAKSGFKARDAYVYLPPAYQAEPRPLLPVLVLMAGQPGTPADWVNSGRLAELLDDFAAGHDGLAPIVLVIDQIGSAWGNPLCMDSRIAKSQTYLAEDVPDWIHTHLQTATGRGSLAIGGMSLGGTCALQLAVNAPQVYGTFLDISGQQEPTLGSHGKTVKATFGGDEAAFDAVDPMHLMARRKFPETAGAFVVGEGDRKYGPQQRRVYAAAVEAGMRATFTAMPGGHDWKAFQGGLVHNLPWLAQQMGLIR